MSQTPIHDFVTAYDESGTVRAHMPGHKGRGPLGFERWDITEIFGADALYEAEGIIAESEARATAHFGFGRTLYSTEGSSQCIRAMLFLAAGLHRGEGRPVILAGRNVHKAFIHACALLDLEVRWLMPEGDAADTVCSCAITPEGLETALAGAQDGLCAVYITAPDYLGGSPDITALAAVCRRHDLPLLVDNAHGAYLRFLQPSRHPIDLGAAISCDSAHKTLPVLTGGAYLHISADWLARFGRDPKTALGLFGSTSPSYLILQSLDLCNRYLEGYPQRLARCVGEIDALKARLQAHGYAVVPSDPLKLVLRDGAGGIALADHLRRHGVEVEFADRGAVVLMLTPETTGGDFAAIEAALTCRIPQPVDNTEALPGLPMPKQALSIRQAVFAPAERIPSRQAVGRICAVPTVACPPAIPIAVSGEIITPEAAATLLAYGIETIEVVRETI